MDKQRSRASELGAQVEALEAQLAKAAKVVEKVKVSLIEQRSYFLFFSFINGFFNFQNQKSLIRQIEAERDRELQDHGCVLAEMQKQYGEERKKSDKLSKQVLLL